MKQTNNENAANRISYVGNVYTIGERAHKKEVLSKLPKKWRELHDSGSIHIHDLDAYDNTYNCLTLDLIKEFPYSKFEKLTEQGKVISLFEFLKELFTNLGNEQSGGMAFANFDNEISEVLKGLSVDYSKYESLISDMIYELIIWCNNNHTRMGQTSYYVTLNIGLANNECACFIANTLIERFKNAGDMVFKPNIVFKVCAGVNLNPHDPNYNLFLSALECTSKKMIPTYILCDSIANKGIDPKVLSIMGCRTRVVNDVYGKIGAIGRGNIANISINLPRLALETIKECGKCAIEEKYDTFVEKWDDTASIVKDILLDRFECICNKTPEDFPTNTSYHLWCENFEGKKDLKEVFKHGTLSIGFIGLSEAIEILCGEKYYSQPSIYINTLAFVRHMRDYCDLLTAKYNLNFSLLATSGEYISGRFIEFDKKIFKSDIDIFSKGYYTNSFHIDVDSGLPGYKKVKLEGLFHSICNGGCITYIELGEAPLGNTEGLKEYINIATRAGVHYLGFNFPKDICNDCDVTGVFDVCLNCGGSNITRVRRVSGYLEILDGFTNGKKAEVKNRRPN